MGENSFANIAVIPNNEAKWTNCIKREVPLYKKENEIRTEFERDYTRILHSTAYRRLKHKTQVFPAPSNDHVCTRIEHVNHVASVSYTISKFLGLNTQLVAAISIGHDLGHAPFGHAGEKVLKGIAATQFGDTFWHEKNSLRFVDKIETLPDSNGKEINLNLTYGVRDGIISHCGEVDENSLFPREEAIALDKIDTPSKYSPYTWEGCVVKVADKISYLGRDIEDALMLNILSKGQLRELRKIVKVPIKEINNTILMHDFIIDLCKQSKPENGITFSVKYLELMNMVKEFNYKNIYFHDRLQSYRNYIELVLKSIYEMLIKLYRQENTPLEFERLEKTYPLLIKTYREWLLKYSNINKRNERTNIFDNEILYDLKIERHYRQSIIDYIAGMTDNFAINVFNELITFS